MYLFYQSVIERILDMALLYGLVKSKLAHFLKKATKTIGRKEY